MHATLHTIHLLSISSDVSQEDGLAIGQLIERVKVEIESGAGMVDSEDVDALAVVSQPPARAACGGIPTTNGGGSANMRIAG